MFQIFIERSILQTGTKLTKLAFQSGRVITKKQLSAIKKMCDLKSLCLRTNKFPTLAENEEVLKSDCTNLTELALSSANCEQKLDLYQVHKRFKTIL